MDTRQVTIPHDYFFKMAIRDYYSWKSALYREFIQNSVDAGATIIEFDFDESVLTIRDNGSGIDDIENVLLTLGGTKKEGDSVGGLGKAKEILYFSWPEWMISSKGVTVTGSGPTYSIKKAKYRAGVTSKIRIGEHIQNPLVFIKDYLACSSLSIRGIEFYYNDEKIGASGIEYDEKIYTIDGLGDLYKVEGERSEHGRIMVQSKGLYMFSNYSVLDRLYVFNITQASYDCLTSNRDSFVSHWQDQFSKMVGKVAIDTESTNLKKETVIQVSALSRVSTTNVLKDIKSQVGEEAYDKLKEIAAADGKELQKLDFENLTGLLNDNFLITESLLDKATQRKIRSSLTSAKKVNGTKIFEQCLKWYKREFPEGFIIVTDQEITTDLAHCLYDIETLKITWLWKEIVDEVAEYADIEKNYGYGIIISEDDEKLAECRNGFILYNPIPYFEMEWEECIVDLILSAAEELTHYVGYPAHNETFKCKFVKILKGAIGGRIKTGDIYKQTKKVTRKHGVKKR